MRAGLLRERIDIEANSGTKDSWGDFSEAWSTYASSVPATITPIRGVERFNNAQVESEVSHKVTIRYSSGVSAVSASHRIKYGSRYFDIQAVINVGERDRMIELMCVER